MKVLFVGNSHQICVQQALRKWPETEDSFEFSQVAAGNLDAALTIVNDAMVPTSRDLGIVSSMDRGSEGEIQIAGYDAIVLAALGTQVPRPANTSAVANLVRFAKFACPQDEGPPLVSETVFLTMLETVLKSCKIVEFANKLYRATSQPVFLLPWPLPCVAAVEPNSSNFQRFYGRFAEPALRWYGTATYRVAERAKDSLEEGVTILDCIPKEWVDSGLSPAEFGAPDPWHMTADYGKMVIEALLRIGRAD
ncbi:MAG: hypothetical protein RIC87_03120 [Kiloniellales bacterium]